MKRELIIKGETIKQRKAEFRAKRVSNKAWVYGYYYEIGRDDESVKAYIVNSDETYEVDPTTVCQYIWMKDSNGNKIYEYDIIFKREKMSSTTYMANTGDTYQTWWENLSYSVVTPKTDSNPGWSGMILIGYNNTKEVVGNIFDTPELMDKKSETIHSKDTVKSNLYHNCIRY